MRSEFQANVELVGGAETLRQLKACRLTKIQKVKYRARITFTHLVFATVAACAVAAVAAPFLK